MFLLYLPDRSRKSSFSGILGVDFMNRSSIPNPINAMLTNIFTICFDYINHFIST